MKFAQLLRAVIERSEIPLRFEPGAEEAVTQPITEMLQTWIAAHLPDENSDTEFDAGYRALAAQLLAELDGSANLPE
ncbi:MAG TPA: hypothetical protein VLW65_11425 [Bryobacteraceae bacterium]|jgi:hypothetical protein|nr:hypothetical protein [Bryobacteraceae bacterium]